MNEKILKALKGKVSIRDYIDKIISVQQIPDGYNVSYLSHTLGNDWKQDSEQNNIFISLKDLAIVN